MVAPANVSSEGEDIAPSRHENPAISNFRSNFYAAASRRHARINGPGISRYAMEHANRGDAIKTSTNLIRVSFPMSPKGPSPVADDEMKDASPPLQNPSVPVQFPIKLVRPEYAEVPTAAIESVDPELAKVDVSYIRDILMENTMGPCMYQILRKYSAKDKDFLSKGVLPLEVTVVVEDMTSILPTHMMAVHGPTPANSKPKVTLFPVHSLILAAHCAKLPVFPSREEHSPIIHSNSLEITLPVRPLFLHSPTTFSILIEFLYLRRIDFLLNRLIPVKLPPASIAQPSQHEALARFIGSQLNAQVLIQQMTIVHGMWQNVCSLGVYDDDLWAALDLAWKLLLMTVLIITGKTELIDPIQGIVLAPGDEKEVEGRPEEKETDLSPN